MGVGVGGDVGDPKAQEEEEGVSVVEVEEVGGVQRTAAGTSAW